MKKRWRCSGKNWIHVCVCLCVLGVYSDKDVFHCSFRWASFKLQLLTGWSLSLSAHHCLARPQAAPNAEGQEVDGCVCMSLCVVSWTGVLFGINASPFVWMFLWDSFLFISRLFLLFSLNLPYGGHKCQNTTKIHNMTVHMIFHKMWEFQHKTKKLI